MKLIKNKIEKTVKLDKNFTISDLNDNYLRFFGHKRLPNETRIIKMTPKEKERYDSLMGGFIKLTFNGVNIE